MLFEEAEKITWIGGEGYAFGAWTAAGAFAAVLCLLCCCRRMKLKAGTGLLMGFASLVCGLVCSRLFFCLTTQELGVLLPVAGWVRVSEGGWSTTGLILGVLLAGWTTAKLTGQSPAKLLDAGCLALPLFMIAERLGEATSPDFNISRVISEETEGGGWLTVQDIYGTYLAVFRIAAIVALALFLVLETVSRRRETKPGDVCVIFLVLFGSVSILTESLRYDAFLSYHFVKFQMVGAALMLGAGLLFAGKRSPRAPKSWKIASGICLFLMVGIVIALEFVLDRTEASKPLVYLGMTVSIAVPAALGLAEIRRERRGGMKRV